MDAVLASLAYEFTMVLSFPTIEQIPTPLSHTARSRFHFTLNHAWVDSTLRAYRSTVTQFHAVGVDKLKCGRTATLLQNYVVIQTFIL